MGRQNLQTQDFSARLSFWLTAALLVALWLTGGASRADALGQPLSRLFAWFALVVFVLISPRLDWSRIRPLVLIAGLCILLVALQLVPLPPAIWTALPGRELLMRAAEVSNQAQPWRSLSVSPGATINALSSLIVPVTVLVVAANLNSDQQWRVGGLLLATIFAGCVLAILQLSGTSFENPLINHERGTVTGNFANRNHFALFVAFGCLLAPIWGFRQNEGRDWKAILSISLLPFFFLIILATGSRSGLVLGALALAFGLAVVWSKMMRVMRSWPRWRVWVIVGGSTLVMIGFLALSIKFDRAVALDRVFGLRPADDLRSQAYPYVIDAIKRYLPVGAGFGTFDPIYRIGEPDAVLRPLYFNHAHNDWLELFLEGGIAAAAVLAGALFWVARAGAKVWRKKGEEATLARVGLAALLLVMLASFSDYPARTPMWMAILTIAALWLHSGSRSSERTPDDVTHR